MSLISDLLVNITLVLGIVFLCIYAYFKYCYTYWARRGVPYSPPTFPLGNNQVLGTSALTFGLESQEWYNFFKKKGLRFGGVYNFCNKALVLVDTELIKDVLTKDFNYFVNRDFFHNPKHDPASKNLFVTEGEEWRYLRQKMSPYFTSAKLKLMFESVNKCSENLVDLFEKAAKTKEDICIRLALDRFTMDNIGLVAYGLDLNCLLGDSTFREITDIGIIPSLEIKFGRVLARLAPKVARTLGLSMLDKKMTTFFSNIISENVEKRRKLNTKRTDFMQLLMELQDNNENKNVPFEMNDIIANCLVFFLAGFDTSSKTMQYTLLELARNQELQEKTRNDIKTVLGKYDGKLTYEGLEEMTYLRQVIDETLRLYPPVLTLSRIANQNYKLKGTECVIEKGTTVIISAIGLQRDPDLFPNPEKYDPDRFSPKNKPNIVSFSYLPFGDGPRNCIGRRFGILQAAIGLAKILSNFKIELSPKVKFPLNIKPGLFILETEEGYVRAVTL